MATVFFMKFNREQGALIADEMTWHLGFKYGYRPSRYGDNIFNLLEDKTTQENDFAAVYAGLGFPSLHFEVAGKSKEAIKSQKGCIGDLDKTADLVQSCYQDAHGRLINDRLRFLLGFDRDEFNLGKFSFQGKEYEINQDTIKNEARKVLKFGEKSDTYNRIFNNEGLVMGYDKTSGIRAYMIGNEGKHLELTYSFGTIGTGCAIGTKVFTDVNYRMQLDERRQGFNFSDGFFTLLNAFVEAYDFNVRTGGYLQIVFIDGKKEYFKNIVHEINDHRGFLTAELARAYRWGFIKREIAQPMMEDLLLAGGNWEEIEKDMLEASSDPALLKKYLMGYKPAHSPKQPLL